MYVMLISLLPWLQVLVRIVLSLATKPSSKQRGVRLKGGTHTAARPEQSGIKTHVAA